MTHIALILDGNRRWATAKGLPKIKGHYQGAKNIKPILQKALDLGISHITMYVLSTENLLNRSETELDYLFELFAKISDYISDFNKHQIKLNAIGDISGLPNKVQHRLQEVMDATTNNNKLIFTLAINYGARNEIIRATNNAITNGKQVTEEIFKDLLDRVPDVDLIIRTGGHQRLSNYLLWQAAYAELYFTNIFWPDFSKEEFQKAYDWFKAQKRNGGK